jgi:hypothetical protein
MPMNLCVERVTGRTPKSPTCFKDNVDAVDDRRPNVPKGVALADEPAARLKTDVIGRVL